MLNTVICKIIEKEFNLTPKQLIKLKRDTDKKKLSEEELVKLIMYEIKEGIIKTKCISVSQASVCLRLMAYLEKNGKLDEDVLKMINGIKYKELKERTYEIR